MTDHHKYGPSALAHYEACPGYLPKENDSVHPVTASGSRIHDAMETGDLSGLETDQEAQLVTLLREWESENLPQTSDWISKREERVEIPVPNLPDDVGTPFGTFDHFLYRLTYGILVDYKGGYIPVESAETNIQLQAYVYGLFHAYPQLQRIKAYILQPRLDRVTFKLYYRNDLLWIERRLQNVITKSLHCSEDDYVPSYDNCVYCARKADCPCIADIAYRTAKRYAPKMIVPKDVHASKVKDAKVMGRMLDIARILEDWASSVKFHAQQLYIQEGTEPKGYTPVTRAGRREITDPIKAMEVVETFGVDRDEFLSTCTVSPRELANRVRDTAKRGDKKRVEAEFTDMLRDAGIYHVDQPTTYLKREHETNDND